MPISQGFDNWSLRNGLITVYRAKWTYYSFTDQLYIIHDIPGTQNCNVTFHGQIYHHF